VCVVERHASYAQKAEQNQAAISHVHGWRKRRKQLQKDEGADKAAEEEEKNTSAFTLLIAIPSTAITRTSRTAQLYHKTGLDQAQS